MSGIHQDAAPNREGDLQLTWVRVKAAASAVLLPPNDQGSPICHQLTRGPDSAPRLLHSLCELSLSGNDRQQPASSHQADAAYATALLLWLSQIWTQYRFSCPI